MAANLQDYAPRMSVQEYLDTEPLSEVKREYLDGMVVAMAGASDRHGLICTALAIAWDRWRESRVASCSSPT